MSDFLPSPKTQALLDEVVFRKIDDNFEVNANWLMRFIRHTHDMERGSIGYDVPLCSGHAESWFCNRDHLKGGLSANCVVCAFGPSAWTLREYIEALFVSGNDVPVDRAGIGADAWDIIKQCLDEDLPLNYDIIMQECVWRRKKIAITERGGPFDQPSPLELFRKEPDTRVAVAISITR